jgi:hypothetical protein
LLALVGAHHILHVSGVRVNLLEKLKARELKENIRRVKKEIALGR